MVSGAQDNRLVGRGGDKVKRRAALTRSKWLELIAEAEKSGESARNFCARRGITEHSFYKWRLIFRREKSTVKKASVNTRGVAAFVPVKIKGDVQLSYPQKKVEVIAAPPKISSPFILRSTNGLSLEFQSGCTASELNLVAEALSC